MVCDGSSVYVVYECDQWLSNSSKVVKSVCDLDGIRLVVEDILKEYGFSDERMDDAIDEFFYGNGLQYRGDSFGIMVEEFLFNAKPYSV